MNFSHKGYELIIEPDGSKFFKGKCEKIGYEQSGAIISWLHDDFIKFVDRNHAITKHEFIYNGYVLEVTARSYTLAKKSYNLNEECVPDSSNTYCGVCEEIGFKKFLCLSIGTLVNSFKEVVDEHEKPEEIEYEGYLLHIEKPDKDNAWYIGKSTFREDWLVASASKEYVEKCFRQDVDEKLEREKIIATVQEAKKGILSYQLDLEAFLGWRGYIVRIVDNGVCSYGRYAIHPDYYQQWRDETSDNFPDWAVVKIW